jgi:hypothetical protein
MYRGAFRTARAIIRQASRAVKSKKDKVVSKQGRSTLSRTIVDAILA